MAKFELSKIQATISKMNLDAWLLYDFRGSNDLALKILKIPPDKISSRRYFYFIPEKGNPVKIVNAIESENLDHLPGNKLIYSSHSSLNVCLSKVLSKVKNVAMEYSPENSIPYVSKVDGGTIELIRSSGVNVKSSANLISMFTAIWTKKQFTENKPVAKALIKIVADSFNLIKNKYLHHTILSEYDVQQYILKSIEADHGYIAEHPPIVAVNENSANPHYAPTKKSCRKIKKNDSVLIDLWAKVNKPDGVWSDITWVGYMGESVPKNYAKIFNIVAEARDNAYKLVAEKFKKNEKVFGYEVDDAARQVISKAGYGKYFIHRTGHSITTEGHGTGAHLDNYETRDERLILPSTSFSIEPGIYLPGKFGIRSEIDVYIHPNGKVISTGGTQKEVIPILSGLNFLSILK